MGTHDVYQNPYWSDIFHCAELNRENGDSAVLEAGEEIQKYGTGEGVRDWLYIKDAVEGIFAVLEFKVPFEIFNIGIGKATSTNHLIDLCEKISGLKANIINVEAPPGDAHFAGIADCSKLKNMTGWEAKVQISEGIKRTYDYMVEQHKIIMGI